MNADGHKTPGLKSVADSMRDRRQKYFDGLVETAHRQINGMTVLELEDLVARQARSLADAQATADLAPRRKPTTVRVCPEHLRGLPVGHSYHHLFEPDARLAELVFEEVPPGTSYTYKRDPALDAILNISHYRIDDPARGAPLFPDKRHERSGYAPPSLSPKVDALHIDFSELFKLMFKDDPFAFGAGIPAGRHQRAGYATGGIVHAGLCGEIPAMMQPTDCVIPKSRHDALKGLASQPPRSSQPPRDVRVVVQALEDGARLRDALAAGEAAARPERHFVRSAPLGFPAETVGQLINALTQYHPDHKLIGPNGAKSIQIVPQTTGFLLICGEPLTGSAGPRQHLSLHIGQRCCASAGGCDGSRRSVDPQHQQQPQVTRTTTPRNSNALRTHDPADRQCRLHRRPRVGP